MSSDKTIQGPCTIYLYNQTELTELIKTRAVIFLYYKYKGRQAWDGYLENYDSLLFAILEDPIELYGEYFLIQIWDNNTGKIYWGTFETYGTSLRNFPGSGDMLATLIRGFEPLEPA